MNQRQLDPAQMPAARRVRRRGRAPWLAAALAGVVLVGGVLSASDATARVYGWRGRPGVVARGPVYWGPAYRLPLLLPLAAPWPYYGYGPRAVVIDGGPTEYVEGGGSGAGFEQGGGDWWYYCRKPKGYYPSVERCPSGWEKVPPGGRP